jgi:putative ABC transport system permease protein
VIVMIAISAGTEATIKDQITSLGSNLIYITASFTRSGPFSSSSGGLIYDDATALEAISGVKAVVVEQSASETVRAGDVSLDSITVVGTSPDFPSVRDLTIADGRYVTATDIDRKRKVAILGYDLAQELFGDADPIGESILVGSVRMTVVGVLAEKGTVGEVDYDSQLYTPITVVLQKFTFSPIARITGDSVRTIFVQVDDSADMDDVILQIQILLAKRHDVSLDSLDFTVTTQQDVIETQESTTAAFRSLLASVTERTREIGVRQSVGATPSDIRWQFLSEALLLSLVGGIIGMLAGIAGAWIFGAASGMRTVIIPTSVLLAFGSAAMVGVFFGFYPANQAAQLDPIDALRHE